MEKILLHELLAAVGGKLLTEEKNQSSGNSSGTLDSGVTAVTPDANNRAGTADRSDSAMTPGADDRAGTADPGLLRPVRRKI